MKQSELKVGEHYLAKVSNKTTIVRLDAIREIEVLTGACSSSKRRTVKRFDVTNMRTERKATFRSAIRFHKPLNAEQVATIGGQGIGNENGNR